LVERGHVYIAQPPLYKLKKGKREQYVKDDQELNHHLLQIALDGAALYPNEDTPGIKSEGLGKLAEDFTSVMNDIQRLRQRFDTEVLEGMLFTDSASDKLDKATVATWLVNVCDSLNHKFNGTRNYKSELKETEDDGWCVHVVRRMHGVDTILLFAEGLFNSEELKRLNKLNQELSGLLTEASWIERGEKKQPVTRFDEVMAWLLKEASRGLNIQRYKGLGEMNPGQLWETTMDPETRRMLQVTIEDAYQADEVFTTLMGDLVEPRREFIEKNALSVSNLDI
jgi:DNA gyrase subunit B